MLLDFFCFVRKLIEKTTKQVFSLGTLVNVCFLSLNDQRQITFKLENRNRQESVSFRSGAVSKIVMLFTFQLQAMVSLLFAIPPAKVPKVPFGLYHWNRETPQFFNVFCIERI